MNEKLQYATMLEIPVNTCNVTYKPHKKRGKFKKRAKNPEAVKEELLSKVNAKVENDDKVEQFSEIADAPRYEDPNAENPYGEYYDGTAEQMAEETADEIDENVSEEYVSASVHPKKRGFKFRFTAVTAEVIAIVALIATIFLTNAFYADSAINVFMRRVFSPETKAAEKTYEDFAPVINYGGAVSLENGVISYSAGGAIYASCDGTVKTLSREADGTYTMTLSHGGNFFSSISGLKYAYLAAGDAAYGNIPVGYAEEGGVKMCFMSGETVITDYTLDNNAVLWAV